MELLEKHFETAFTAPNGIQKLRELILTLAMQGKLVPQDPHDQSASELLKEIAAERKRLVREGKTREQKPLPQITLNDVPYELPKGWEWVRLGEVQEFTNGYAFNSTDYQESGIGVIRMTELGKDGQIDESSMKYISCDVAQTLSDIIQVKPGDILMGMSGATIGKLAVNTSSKTYLLNQRVGRLKPIVINERFLRLFLNTVVKYYLAISFGMAIRNLSTKQINETPFPLPPLPEQHRIVAKIDELMARCDELERLRIESERKRLEVHKAAVSALLAAQDKDDFGNVWQFISQHFSDLYAVKENVADLRKAILQLAVMGKLVPQDPHDQSASELLKEIAAERKRLVREGKIKAHKASVGACSEDGLAALPCGWARTDFGQIYSLEYGDGLSAQARTNSGEYPVYGSNGVVGTHCIPLIHEPCMVIGRKGSAGAINLCPGKGCWITDVAYYCIPPTRVDLQFSFWLFRSLHFESLSKGIKPGLNREEAYRLLVSIPPLPEQHRIVAKIDELMARCDELETHISAAIGKQTALLNAVMAQV